MPTDKQEPAFLVGLIGAVLTLLLEFGVPGLSVETVGLIMAVVMALGGLYVAWKTTHVVLGALVALLNASIALASGYGFDLSQGQQAALIALVTVIVGAWQRTQVSPLAVGTFKAA
jgi:hypothetical protein